MRLCPFFFFNDTATTEIYTLSLHDALPILASRSNWSSASRNSEMAPPKSPQQLQREAAVDSKPSASSRLDRKSTRLNSSHQIISYAVFCLKKKSNQCR